MEAPGEQESEAEIKDVGFIVVSSGAGFKETFESLGADIVVEGGQTMNPSTEDFIEAIERLKADNVLLFPNNKNIILAAEQAAELIEDKNVIVIPTKSVPQGVSALINYSDLNSVEENAEEMLEVIQHVRTGQITYAVRDTVFDGKEIKTGDFLCIVDGKIILVAQDMQQGAKELLDFMLENGGEVLSIFYGETVADETAGELLDYVTEKHPEVEAEVQFGGQPVYYYVFSVE
jgi:dihydroxyacetone kinase-like predicted kinase